MSLENVQAGDELVRTWNRKKDLVTVDRVTKTQIVIGHGRYRKRDGFQVGSSRFNRGYLRLPVAGEVEQLQEQVRHNRLCHMIAGACEYRRLKEMTLEQLTRIREALTT